MQGHRVFRPIAPARVDHAAWRGGMLAWLPMPAPLADDARRMVRPLPAPTRRFLFLQGPPGPFFHQLAVTLGQNGHVVRRIHLNGGDEYDWPGAVADASGSHRATCYRGTQERWPLYIDRYLRREAITDMVLFGDCRPMHMVAHQMARLNRVRVHVFEEGYIRPNWLTLERDGVNGHSPLPRRPQDILAAAHGLPRPTPMLPIGASLGRRVRDTWGYFGHMMLGALMLRYPFYRSHRPGSVLVEGAGWIAKYLMRARQSAKAQVALKALEGRSYFLFPLQLSSDYQIRVHSPFSSMRQAADYVLASFAAHAPRDACLVIKEHPLDATLGGWGGYVRNRARALGLGDRLVHLAGGDLDTLARGARAMVVVNSTSATFALAGGIPVKALGRAVYAMPGITDERPLARFWADPTPPDPTLYDAFCRVLHRHCLVRGGLASESAMRILIANAVERLVG
ncbi:capsule biosynthesis protein [Novosphingobium sp. KACC 22771]|uniref:capsule biosynthesis protein n=1 Tax=Novosphingobium sp. KACC 22771 TaxID=3025670 RepID=UPI00236613EF|nr:capsular biosynthesis protein [Novosphingobium sp. KACC 22771]WDF71903.1 capsular biosynthesis protein [Novosphingobium sp. KACC 22771]